MMDLLYKFKYENNCAIRYKNDCLIKGINLEGSRKLGRYEGFESNYYT